MKLLTVCHILICHFHNLFLANTHTWCLWWLPGVPARSFEQLEGSCPAWPCPGWHTLLWLHQKQWVCELVFPSALPEALVVNRQSQSPAGAQRHQGRAQHCSPGPLALGALSPQRRGSAGGWLPSCLLLTGISKWWQTPTGEKQSS